MHLLQPPKRCVHPVGVLLPLLSRKVRWFGVESTPFVMGRAFAAGVVLATGFVHMFPEAIESLENPCLGWIGAPCAAASLNLPALCLLVCFLSLTSRQVRKGGACWYRPWRHKPGCA